MRETEMVCELVKLLSFQRANSYGTWIETGRALFNIDTNLLEVFKEFSRKSDKYDELTCERLWNTWRKNDEMTDVITIASLYFWAQTDNPTEYELLLTNSVNYSILFDCSF